MSDPNPNESKSTSSEISDQLNELGRNLRDALHSAWESEERRKLQKEIEDGLDSLGKSLSQAAKDFSNSPRGQALKEDVNDMRERWRTGEMSSKAHSEIVEALRKINNELQKTVKQNPPPPDKPSA